MELAILLELLLLAEKAYRAFARAKGLSEEEQDAAIKEAREMLDTRPMDKLKEV